MTTAIERIGSRDTGGADSALLEIDEFLGCPTPQAWVDAALANQQLLLIDHANCEKKAAATAMQLMYRHTVRPELLKKMSQLAREELLHFQQVVELMQSRGINYRRLSPSRYAGELLKLVNGGQEEGLIDILLIGAFIEARSCERFARLVSPLRSRDPELARFYASLLKSEARHYQDYLMLARTYYPGPAAQLAERVDSLRQRERALIQQPDSEFRFHSGPPELATA